jgi:trimeric autotransporter adhesin
MNEVMKKRNYLLLLLLLTINSSIAQVGVGTTAPDAQLDIRSSNQAAPANNDGILIPKVDAFPATNPTVAQQGMLVYLTTPTTFGGNPKPIGFYYWDNITPDWVGISSAANGDHDWYEVGTTTAPNAITDDMFHTGNVAIGKNTANFPLEVTTTAFDTGINNLQANNSNNILKAIENTINGTGTGSHYGFFNSIAGIGSGSQYGNTNQISNSGNGTHFGTENSLSGAGDGAQYATFNSITNTGNGSQYGTISSISGSGFGNHFGVYSSLPGIGTGDQYGVYSQIANTSNSTHYGNATFLNGSGSGAHYGSYNSLFGVGTGDHFAIFNNLTGNGVGLKVGMRSIITSTNTAGIYGINNIINGGGTSVSYGVYNTLFGNSTGIQVSSYNDISNTGTGDHYGTRNSLSGAGTGIKYGTYNLLTTTAGGTHYGVYSEALKAGATNFAGYFLGNVGIGTTAANTYTFPPSRGANNQIMITNGTGVVSWQNASAIQDHDWYEVGTTLAPDAITDVMFHTGNVSIGKITNTYPLDVTSATRTINSVSSIGTSAAVFGFNTAVLGAGAGGYGVAGQTSQSSSQAVRGEQLNTAGYAIAGINFGASGASSGSGLYGQTSQSNGFGIDSRNVNASGTAIFSSGQNAAGNYLIAGSGGSFNGVTTGIHARNTSLGISEAIYSDNGGIASRVNYWSGTTQYKILGTGTVSTTAENINGERVTLHCTEAPEIYFEDYGQGQLINGSVHIEIDPTIAKNIVVNDKHPLRVYIQLEDNCNGVYVTNKTGSSFDVIELASGQSNAKFQYHIVGNRADEVLPNGRISKNADMRFEPAPKNKETREATAVDVGKPATVK